MKKTNLYIAILFLSYLMLSLPATAQNLANFRTASVKQDNIETALKKAEQASREANNISMINALETLVGTQATNIINRAQAPYLVLRNGDHFLSKIKVDAVDECYAVYVPIDRGRPHIVAGGFSKLVRVVIWDKLPGTSEVREIIVPVYVGLNSKAQAKAVYSNKTASMPLEHDRAVYCATSEQKNEDSYSERLPLMLNKKVIEPGLKTYAFKPLGEITASANGAIIRKAAK